jgi:glycosyltransferase involved in cell wall biosynthesis
VLRAFQPDVVYLWNLLGIGGLGLVACLRHLGIPWVWHLMDAVPTFLCSGEGVNPVLVQEFNRQISGSYLACSLRVVDEVAASGIELRGKLGLIPNWVTGPRRHEARQYYQGGKLRIVSAGQIGWQKGTDILIESARRLRDSGLGNFSVDLFGKVGDPAMTERIRASRLEDRITLRGLKGHAEIIERFREYDVLAFPTWEREPCAFAPLEAASQGCVPIVTRTCGNAEWLIHGIDCLKIDRSPESLTQSLRDVLEGRINLGTLARRGADRVQQDFHLDELLPRIEQTLAEASHQARTALGTAEEAYRLALLAEKLTRTLMQEPVNQGGLFRTLLSFGRRFWPIVQQYLRPLYRRHERSEAVHLENLALRRRMAHLESRLGMSRSLRDREAS